MSEWAASYKRDNDKVDSVKVMAELANGACLPIRETLIAALPEMRRVYACPESRTDLQFLLPREFQGKTLMSDMHIKRFYLEYSDITQKDARANLRV